MKVYLDVNIFISYLDDKREKHHEANELLSGLYINNHKMYLSEDILTNVIYNVKDLREITVKFFREINSDNSFKIVNFGKKTIDKACDFYLSQGIFTNKGDFEDILQYFCALQNGCERIYTNDKSNFPRLDIPLYESSNKPFFTP